MPQGVQLYYNQHFLNCFQTLSTSTRFTFTQSYDDLLSLMRPYAVAMGKDCIDTGKPLFTVTILQHQHDHSNNKQQPHNHGRGSSGPYLGSQAKQIQLIVSLSPVLGDIHTFYQLYEMLDPNKDIRILQMERNFQYPSLVKQTIGWREYNWLHDSLLFKIGSSVLRFFLSKPQIFTVYFDHEEWVLVEKKRKKDGELVILVDDDDEREEEGGQRQMTRQSQPQGQSPQPQGQSPQHHHHHAVPSLPYLSTNDLLTSWFFRLCQCDYGLMTINFRNRLSRTSLESNMAGNYSDRIIYRPVDYAQPSLIRLSLGSYRRCGKQQQQKQQREGKAAGQGSKYLSPAPHPSAAAASGGGGASASSPSSSSLSSASSFFTFTSSSPLPSLWTSLQNHSSECQNWCQPYRNICLLGVIQTLHLPLLIRYDETITTRDTLIIFRPTYGTLGGIVISHSSKIQNLFQNMMTRFEENQWRSRGGGGGAGTGSRQRDYHNNQQESGEGKGGGGGGGSSGDGQDEEWVAPIRNMMLRGRPASWTVAAAAPSSSTTAAAGSG
jgi:hypothetical protein